eukprot:scaffold1167_cov418-Prasinococcus_capsulatus_cf.AAC.35
MRVKDPGCWDCTSLRTSTWHGRGGGCPRPCERASGTARFRAHPHLDPATERLPAVGLRIGWEPARHRIEATRMAACGRLEQGTCPAVICTYTSAAPSALLIVPPAMARAVPVRQSSSSLPIRERWGQTWQVGETSEVLQRSRELLNSAS